MKLLHTGDWHVGKAVRGRSRAEEFREVLEEIAGIADIEGVDLVLVAGDLFDTAAPAPEAEQIVYRALLRLAEHDRTVVVLSGNHDNAQRLAAVAPVFAPSNVIVQTSFARADDGGVVHLADCGGVPVNIGLVPFLSPRYVVRADALMGLDADDHVQTYVERVARFVDLLRSGFSPDAVNLVVAHLMVVGGVLGGGERAAQTIFEYAVPASAFPSDAQYVALGHLHRSQRMGGAGQIWYSGSPLQLDFGEERDDKVVHIVQALPGEPAAVRTVPLRAGRRFRTLQGTLESIAAEVAEGAFADDFVRVVVTEPGRADLADDVRAIVADPVEIRVEAPEDPDAAARDPRARDLDRHTPAELFGAYLRDAGIEDDRLESLFRDLYDEYVTKGSHAT